jgi:hypothetical protein
MVDSEFTYLFCLDDKRSYSVEVKRRFNDASRYMVFVSQSRNELLNLVKEYIPRIGYKIAILPYYNLPEFSEPVQALAKEIQRISQGLSIVLLVHGDSPEESVQKSGIEAYSWVPASNNSILRIHNSVKKLISEKSLEVRTRRRKFALWLFIAVLMISLIGIVAAYLRFPQYF